MPQLLRRLMSDVIGAEKHSPKTGLKFLRRGKVKEIYEVSEDVLEFRFTDDISVFDLKIPNTIPHKGETLARTSVHWFKTCTKIGVNHHYLDLIAGNRMRVRRVEVIPDISKHEKKGVLIPLEFIMRYYVAGTLWDRVKKEKVGPTDLGFPSGHAVVYGEKLPVPRFEMTTKLEHTDRLLDEKEAMKIGGLNKANLRELEETIFKVDHAISKDIEPRGLIHVDGKKEFAFDGDGKIMLVDTFGTGDEDRFWDSKEMARGRYEDFSKEFVRQHYRRIGFYDELMKAREAHLEEPQIPPLPPHLVDEVSKMYTTIYQRLTGEPFRPMMTSRE